MQDVTLVVMSAGNATRFREKKIPKKQWLYIGSTPLWQFVLDRLAKSRDFGKVIVTAHPEETGYMRAFTDAQIVEGGDTRQKSLLNALKEVETDYVMVTDVARPGIPDSVIDAILEHRQEGDCIAPALSAHDTTVYGETTIDRNALKLIQTPQLSRTEVLKKALQGEQEFTDDRGAIEAMGGRVVYIPGSRKSHKITYMDDLREVGLLRGPSRALRCGMGFDTHAFEEGKPMLLGGVAIDSAVGFKAHSDGDVLIHSVIDALLGAAGAGDIGEWFPDTDPRFRGADSKVLLKQCVEFISDVGMEIVNVDVAVLAEIPRLKPHKESIRQSMAELLGIARKDVNIKATTMEKMGFIGRGEGLAVQSVATLTYFDWKDYAGSYR